MDRIDFRSDTVTWPTPRMRQAMASAVVGDDVYGEDPTVNELEALAAQRVGTESALLVSSGTMGNIAAILSHTQRGDEAILGVDSHIMVSEGGGISSLAGVMAKPMMTDAEGRMDLDQVVRAINPDNPHYTRTRLILVENTYGVKDGYPIHPDYFAEISRTAVDHNLAVHLDGARLFNAAVALDIEVQEITQFVDSVSFCLSKGLGAPIGSMLCGSEEFIHQAKRNRKVLGGGMRQAGIIAAAGIVALEEMVERLAVDHHNARLLAEGLADIPGVKVELERINTNLIFFGLRSDVAISSFQIAEELQNRANIWIDAVDERMVRVVTHYWVGEPEIELLLHHLRAILDF